MEEKKKGGGKPVSTEERAKRFAFIENLLAGLVPPEQAVLQFRAEFKTGESTARRYLAKVREQWSKESEPTREAKRLEIERAADNAYRQAIALGEVSPAVSALRLKAQLHGLANRIEVTGPNGGPIEVDHRDVLSQAIAKLAASPEQGTEESAPGQSTTGGSSSGTV